jgi:hypothetical protein
MDVPRDGAMLMCVSGHNVCVVCKNKMAADAKCPQGGCAFATPPAKNFAVASMIEKLPFEWPCKNADAGCDVKDTSKALKAHEALCHLRRVPCPNFGCGDRITFSFVFAHLNIEHGIVSARDYAARDDDALWISWKRSWTSTEELHWIKKAYIVSFGWTLLCATFQKGELFVWLWANLDEDRAAEFECAIALDNGKEVSVRTVCPVYAIDWSRDAIMKDEGCMRINWWYVRKMLTDEGVTPVQKQEGYSRFKINFKVARK